MPLTLVLGPANSAKAGDVLGAYVAAARRDAILVVPTAADAVHYDRELAGSGVTLGRALTFDGLLGEIALRARYTRARLSPLRRDLLIRRAVAGLKLETLGESAATPGFAASVGRLISTLASQRVTPQRFSQALSSWSDGPYSRDLAAIYRRYAAALQGADAEDAESHAWGALDALRADPVRWRATPVFFYGFDDLTTIEQDAVETLARAAEITVSLTYEPGRPALAARATVVEDLREQAATVRELPALDTYYAASQLHHLERHLFEADAPVIDPGGAVEILEAGGERAEAELVTAEVLAALREGVGADEIVVVTRSLRRAGGLLEATLIRHGVPATSSRRIPFTHTALGRGLWELLAGDALAYLRVSSADLPWVDAVAARIGREGSGEINVPWRGLDDALEALLPRPDGRMLTAEEQLDVRAAATLRAALDDLGTLNDREMVELLERLEVGAAAPGGVLIAEPLAIRARRFRRVFVTGLCEGEFPAADPPDPFIGEDRRRELALASGLALEPPPEPAARERYLLYACVSRASERIAFSFRSSDEDGNQVAASPFLDDVLALFSEVPRRRRLLADVIWSPEEAPTAREYALAAAGVALGSPPPTGPSDTRTLSAAALSHARHTERISPGAIEKFAKCPVAWLVESQLRPAELQPDGDPLVKGNLMHEVLRRIVSGEADVLATLTPPPDLAPGRPPAVRHAILAGIVAELERYLVWEADHATPGFTPEHLEFGFEVELDGGLTVAGKIDRVDIDARGRAIVRDYKSGRDQPGRAAGHWLDDVNFQAGLYMLATRRLLPLKPIAGIYQPLTGQDLRPRGAALREAGLPLRPADVLDELTLETLLAEVETEVNRLAAQLRRGELTPCPETCSPDGCRHPGICWAGR
jgi:ATP-dependent helicase/DNAse subunit B